jgi:hypothetical protein
VDIVVVLKNGRFPSGYSLCSSWLKRGDTSSFFVSTAFLVGILNQNKWARKGLLLPCCSFPSSFRRGKLVAHRVGFTEIFEVRRSITDCSGPFTGRRQEKGGNAELT